MFGTDGHSDVSISQQIFRGQLRVGNIRSIISRKHAHRSHAHGEPDAINTITCTVLRGHCLVEMRRYTISDRDASFCAPTTPGCPTSNVPRPPFEAHISGPCATLPGPLLSVLAAHERSTYRATIPRLHLTTIALPLPSSGSVKFEIHPNDSQFWPKRATLCGFSWGILTKFEKMSIKTPFRQLP